MIADFVSAERLAALASLLELIEGSAGLIGILGLVAGSAIAYVKVARR